MQILDSNANRKTMYSGKTVIIKGTFICKYLYVSEYILASGTITSKTGFT